MKKKLKLRKFKKEGQEREFWSRVDFIGALRAEGSPAGRVSEFEADFHVHFFAHPQLHSVPVEGTSQCPERAVPDADEAVHQQGDYGEGVRFR